MGERVEVNQEQLKLEITNLQRLLKQVQEDKGIDMELQGEGFTKEYMDIVKSGLNGLMKTLQLLIENTVILLENISDGYVEIDEVTAKQIQEFNSEILRNE